MSAIPNTQLTHLGIFVHDSDLMAKFFTKMFGMVISDQGEFKGKHLTFMTGSTNEHHQVVLVRGRTGEPTTKILGQLSFRVDSLDDLRTFLALSIELGATEQEARNHGNSWSIYFRDPEYNFIEMYVVSPWQVHQPWRIPLDLDQSNKTIIADTKQLIDEAGVSIPLDQWEQTIGDRLANHRAGTTSSAAATATAAPGHIEEST